MAGVCVMLGCGDEKGFAAPRDRPVPHLDPAIRARLVSALQRPDLKPTTRAKIEVVLGPNDPIKLQHACRH